MACDFPTHRRRRAFQNFGYIAKRRTGSEPSRNVLSLNCGEHQQGAPTNGRTERSHHAAIKNHGWSYVACQRRAQSYATTLPPSNGSITRSAAPQTAPLVSLEPYTPPLNRSFILDGVASTH